MDCERQVTNGLHTFGEARETLSCMLKMCLSADCALLAMPSACFLKAVLAVREAPNVS